MPHQLAMYALAFAASLVLAAFLTPRHWWRRPNLKALAVLVAGTWGLGAMLLAFVPERAEARPAAPLQAIPAIPVTPALPAQVSYRVHEDLNLRAAAGTGARRLALVPAGATVTTTGAREGDWWQVRTRGEEAASPEIEGWVSSLWLRRAEEARTRRGRSRAGRDAAG